MHIFLKFKAHMRALDEDNPTTNVSLFSAKQWAILITLPHTGKNQNQNNHSTQATKFSAPYSIR